MGNGTLVLTGDNTYSGGTTVSAGTLQVGDGTNIGTLGTGCVMDNACLTFYCTDTATITNGISGSGMLSTVGTGTVILTGDSTYTGGTDIEGGTLQVGNGGTTGMLGSGIVEGNGTLVFDRSDTVMLDTPLSGAVYVTQEGRVLTLTGDNDYTGTTTINTGSTLQVGNGYTTGMLGSGIVEGNGTLVFDLAMP